MCASVSFVLHGAEECNQLQCPAFDPLTGETMTAVPDNPNCKPYADELHSLPVQHHANLKDLEQSASQDCHLCALLHAALALDDAALSTISGCISLRYREFRGTEVISVACADIRTQLETTPLPGMRCGDEHSEKWLSNVQSRWSNITYKAFKTPTPLFFAIATDNLSVSPATDVSDFVICRNPSSAVGTRDIGIGKGHVCS